MRKRLQLFVFCTLVCVLGGSSFSGLSYASDAPKQPAQTSIQIYTTPQGSNSYSLAWGICDLLKKNSSWLRGTVEVALGPDFLKLMHVDPKRKPTAVGMMVPDVIWFGEHVLKISDLRFLGLFRTDTAFAGLVTFNPAIKSWRDLKGKRIALGKAGTPMYTKFEAVMKQGWGIWDQVKVEGLTFGPNKDALLDGTVDVGQFTGGVLKEKVAPTPAAAELLASGRPMYPVDMDNESVRAAAKKTGRPLRNVPLPPGVLGKHQSQPFLTMQFPMAYYASPQLPAEVAYELCRVVWENIEKLKEYHASGAFWSREIMPEIRSYKMDEIELHPGALRFYQEKASKTGK